MSAPDEARAELVEALARADYIHRGESPPTFWEDLPEWQRAKHRDHADQQVDDALAHPATLIAALGGEQVGWQDRFGIVEGEPSYAMRVVEEQDELRDGPYGGRWPVYRFPALEDKS